MTDFTVINHAREQAYVEDSVNDAENKKSQGIEDFGFAEEDIEIVRGAYESYEDYTEEQAGSDEMPDDEPVMGVDICVHCDSEIEDGHCPDCDTADTAEADGGTTVEATPAEPAPEPADLSKDPIGFLKSVNSDFVNTIQGTPAISKQGFRFIQREFEISTESEVVEWSDDPLGCVVWARAELPGGYAAEAHGEGYQFESDVSDNEFVRYADTRAKNRAISDLTSAGALAVSELQGQE